MRDRSDELDSEKEYRLLNDTEIPILLIWGQEDQTISADHIEILRNHLPEIEYALNPNAGHIPHYERPDLSILYCWNFWRVFHNKIPICLVNKDRQFSPYHLNIFFIISKYSLNYGRLYYLHY